MIGNTELSSTYVNKHRGQWGQYEIDIYEDPDDFIDNAEYTPKSKSSDKISEAEVLINEFENLNFDENQ